MIPITQPFLPPVEEYKRYIDGIWQRKCLTNIGPLTSDLEMQLKDHLGVQHLLYVTNGTIALQIAIKALNLKGEIITTPFSFVSTTSSIVWEGCTPVFVDIDPENLTIDVHQLEAAITKQTTAILATHVYGNPCDVEAIDRIAKKHNLKVIYDGAHAFGVKLNGKSIFEYGDISTCSLHATKSYHSTEGGLVVTRDPELLKKMASIRNFGISGFNSFDGLGINAKNSEFHAAMGLANLKYIDYIIQKRKVLCERYDQKLVSINAVKPLWNSFATQNYAYYPLVFESEELLLKVKSYLEQNEVFTRRYFYPSLAVSLPYLPSQNFPVTDDCSKRVLCLPLYTDLSEVEVDWICRLISRVQNNKSL